MLVEIDEAIYDLRGKSVAGIRKRHRLADPKIPFGRFFSQPLVNRCSSVEEIREFLRACRYVSDLRQFGRDDHWVSPEDFENSRKGDCEDFALWAWRQLAELGYECRFVAGSSGRYGEGHAWITVTIEGKPYLFEPQARRWPRLPRLALTSYDPVFSVEWDGRKARFFEHEPTKPFPTFAQYVRLAPEWVLFHTRRVVRFVGALARLPFRIVWRLLRGRRLTPRSS